MSRTVLLGLFLLVLSFNSQLWAEVAKAKAGDWPWWRGPNFNGVADEGQDPPVKWSESENILWKVSIPGRGHSSPIIAGDRIYLTSAEESAQRQAVLAFERESGKQVWLKQVSQGGFPRTHAKNTHATSTVACDGERLLATFHHHDKLTLAALSLEGELLWDVEVGPYSPKLYEYGYAPSPLIYEKNVIIAADYEKGGYLVAYDRATGKQAWRTKRPLSYSFSSPVIATVAGKDQLFMSGCDLVSSYNPKTGKDLWNVKGTTMATCGTMVWDGNLVFASGGYPVAQTLCVKADGSKQVVWTNNTKCYEQSMLAHKGHVYAFTDQGIAICWRGSDGREMWKQRLAGPVSSSPILCGDRIYATNEQGTTYVFRASPEQFEPLGENRLGEEGFSTMAICGGKIYLRTASRTGAGGRQESLYCIGTK